MANALPIVLAAGAAALLLGKKKKKSSEGGEPEFQPGAGFGEGEDVMLSTIPAKLADDDLLLAAQAIPAKEKETPILVSAVEAEVDKDPPKKAPSTCKFGAISTDKKYVCWGLPKGGKGQYELQVRRVPRYKTARNAAAAVAMTGGVNASPLLMNPKIKFALWCWLNRNKRDIYKCIKRYRTGKKRCYKWERY